MRETPGISEQGEQIIQDFIHALTTHEDLNPKTLWMGAYQVYFR